MVPKQKIKAALIGNPNSGKTTIFNALTGQNQKVANYPGVTVEIKEGIIHTSDADIHIVDCPGTYSLLPYSLEERIARKQLMNEKIDVVIDVIDSTNLERGLFLALQIRELGLPVILALNMTDVIKMRGLEIDYQKLSNLLTVPVVPTVGRDGTGLNELVKAILETATKPQPPMIISYGAELEKASQILAKKITLNLSLEEQNLSKWLALKLLEGDCELYGRFEAGGIIELTQKLAEEIKKITGDPPAVIVAERIYGIISGITKECIQETAITRKEASDKIDNILLSHVVGIPIFLFIMYVMFNLTFTLAAPFTSLLEIFFGWLSSSINVVWADATMPKVKSLLIDGIIGGVGGILALFPNIFFLFVAISILEDSGYMARAAFLMDRFMHKVGLHGKAFIPVLLGFGCSVPAIMATRILDTHRDRLTTMLVLPIISCGARLPIYTLIIPAFFPQMWQGTILFMLYFVGIIMVLIGAKILRLTIFKGETESFLMELPAYRMPTIRNILLHAWERGKRYLQKAGTIILGASIIMWFLSTYPEPPQEAIKNGKPAIEYSFAGKIGKALEPIMKPLGFDWKICTSFIGAIPGKEMFVAQLGILYSINEEDETSQQALREALRKDYTPLTALSILFFAMLTMPCLATLAIMKQEGGRWKWVVFQAVGLTTLAYIVSLIIFQIGKLLGFN